MSDAEKALSTCLEFLEKRTVIRARLLGYAGLGIRAQCVEQSRTVGFSYEREDEEPAGPRVSDPTFNAASRPDEMLSLLADVDRAEQRLITACNRLIGHPRVLFPDQLPQVLRAYRGSDDLTNRAIRDCANVFLRAMSHTIDVNTEPAPGLSADGRPGCESCARHKDKGTPWFSEPTYNRGNPSDLGGLLRKSLRLCDACFRFAIAQEPTRLPTLAELKHRYEHPRGHWPKRHSMPKTRAS